MTALRRADPETRPARPADPRVRLALLAAGAVLFLASLGQTSVSTALPIIVGDLGRLDHVAWVVTAYLLAATVGAPIFGKLGDLFGRRAAMRAGIALFLVGAVICGLAVGLWMLIVGRFLQGLGGGGLIVVAMATVADVLPPRRRGRAQGALGAVFGVSTMVGPLAGGLLVEHFGWPWIFWVNLPVALVALAVLNGALEPAPAPARRPRIDYAGAGCLAVLLGGLVVAAALVGQPGAGAALAALAALIPAALAGFVTAERRAPEPLLPLDLFRINNVLVANLVGTIVGAAMFGTITFVPMFMQVVKGATPAVSGLFLVPLMAGLIATSNLAGAHMARSGRYRMLPVLSTLVLALAMAGLAGITPQSPAAAIAGWVLLAGLGIGPVISVSVTAIQNAVPRRVVGVGTASANMFRLIGGSLGTAAFGALFAAGLAERLAAGGLAALGPGQLTGAALAGLDPSRRQAVAEAVAAALHPVFWWAAVLALAASAAALRMRETPLADERADCGADYGADFGANEPGDERGDEPVAVRAVLRTDLGTGCGAGYGPDPALDPGTDPGAAARAAGRGGPPPGRPDAAPGPAP